MSDYALDNLRHTAAHLLAAAVQSLFPAAKLTLGPPVADGFYYDIDFVGDVFSEDQFARVEQKMDELLKTWDVFSHREVSADEARQLYADNPYKLEIIEEIVSRGEPITLYTCGGFTDLCRGGHSEHPNKELKHVKLMSVAGAYWRGKSENPMLTRIYGTAFFTKDDLVKHLAMLEEAKRRDHRKIGQEQELFCVDERVGKGLILWLPHGTIIRNEVEKLAEDMENRMGYERVVTPHIAKEELFLTSGHLPYYKDSMYPPMVMDDGTYYLKAMNCPHHHSIYLFRKRSYRELPVRFAEYGMCYRNELSGTLAGLLRVRGMAMNDAHIYCRKEQIKDEFARVLAMTQEYFRIFGFEDYWFRLSKWSPEHTEKYIDEPENWAFAEGVLREVLTEMGVRFVEVENEAAFYGPKVDVQFRSVIGREETMSTVQLDFVARTRFGLSYVDETGAENGDVFVIHRAPLSVHERFLAFLIEHYAGVWPVWLSPVQVSLLPVSTEKHLQGASELAQELRATGIRVQVDGADETVGKKIRNAAKQKIPYVLVVGDKELSGGDVTVRVRGQEEQITISREAFLARVAEDITARRVW
jgi:threonyl-tRNA synthetase